MNVRPHGYSKDNAAVPALIMGNGPSLARLRFAETGGFATFGMNAAYRHWQRIDWWPDYYACLDSVVGESHRTAIHDLIERAGALGIRRFLLRHRLIRKLGRAGRDPRITCYERLLADGAIPKLHDVTTGSHTLLWAQSLGYSTILLAGVDCDYQQQVAGAERRGNQLEIVRKSDNPNYFFDDYQRPGDRYNIPDATPDMHVVSWRNAARFLAASTRVVNLNPDSRVDAFPFNHSPDYMEPGDLVPARAPGTTAAQHVDFAFFQRTLRRCTRYRPKGEPDPNRQFLEDWIDPPGPPVTRPWRAPGSSPISVSVDAEPTARPACLTIRIAELGVLQMLMGGDETDEAHASVQVRLHDVHRLRALAGTILALHRALGRPPWTTRLFRPIRGGFRTLGRLIPWRVRAVDWRAVHRRALSRSSI